MDSKRIILVFATMLFLIRLLSLVHIAFADCTSSCGSFACDADHYVGGYYIKGCCSDPNFACCADAEDWEVAKVHCGWGWPIDSGDQCWTECSDTCCANYCENTENHDWGVCSSGDYDTEGLSGCPSYTNYEVRSAHPSDVGYCCCYDLCPEGYKNCDSNPMDCETYVLDDPNNCGDCGIVCPSGQICVNGNCQPPPSCSDTDADDSHPNGNNPGKAGTCKDTSGSHSDYCDGNTLHEYYCSGGSCVETTHKCHKTPWSSGNNCYYNYRCSYNHCTHSTDSKKPSCSPYSSGNTCYYDGSAECTDTYNGWYCWYSADSNKPSTYYYNSTNKHCYYSCSVTCGSKGWQRSGCTDGGAKPCNGAVCTSSGWDTSHCIPQYGVRVFVTSQRHNGNFGGLSGANAKCQQAADNAGLGGTWIAWLSDSSHDARDRITHTNYGYYLINGTKIADNFSDLVDGTLDHPINLDENGNVVAFSMVFTGTNENGYKSSSTCNNWSSSSYSSVIIGLSYKKDKGWTNMGRGKCSYNNLALYCFEVVQQPNTPPSITLNLFCGWL